MTNERCELCRNYKRLKHNFEKSKGFEESHVCTLFADDGVYQEVTPNGLCEMFQEVSE